MITVKDEQYKKPLVSFRMLASYFFIVILNKLIGQTVSVSIFLAKWKVE